MNCKDCEHLVDYERDTGAPICELEDSCPYDEEGEAETEDTKMTITIDLEDMKTRITNAFSNSISSQVRTTIAGIVRDGYEKKIRDCTEKQIEKCIIEEVAKFMSADITIGGGWHEPQRTLTRNEYLAETISEKLAKDFDEKKFAESVKSQITSELTRACDSIRNEANRKIKALFDEAMRTNLTDNIVQLLMSNETYKKLSASMTQLIAKQGGNL